MLIRMSTAAEKEAIITLADRAFAKPAGSFAALLPAVYGPQADCSGNHLLLYEQVHLCALMLIQPLTLQVQQSRIQAAALGTVCVDPAQRGKGRMRQLLDFAMARLREKGVALAWLGGQRQRYAPWGFEPCGLQTCYVVTEASRRHTYGDSERQTVSIKPLQNTDAAALQTAYQMWAAQDISAVRSPAQFGQILHSHGGHPYVCMLQNEMKGYLVLSGTQGSIRILELVTAPALSVRAVIQAVFRSFHIDSFDIKVPPYKVKLSHELEQVCEQEIIGANHKYRIINWEKVAQAYFNVKAAYCRLADGRLSLLIREPEGSQYLLKISVIDNIAAVSGKAVGDHDGTDILEMTAAQAQRLMFAPVLTQSAICDKIPYNWFPLPLYMGELDCC